MTVEPDIVFGNGPMIETCQRVLLVVEHPDREASTGRDARTAIIPLRLHRESFILLYKISFIMEIHSSFSWSGSSTSLI